jgi:hypothetical protein
MLPLWVPCLRSRRHAGLTEKTWLRQRSHGTRTVSFLGAAQRRSNLNLAALRVLRCARNDIRAVPLMTMRSLRACRPEGLDA